MSDGAIPGYQGGCNMPTISNEQIEAQAEYTSGLEAEILSYVEELAEIKLLFAAAEAEIRRIRSAYPDVG